MTEKRTSIFENGLIWFGAGVSLAEILTGTYFASLGFGKGLLAIIIGHIIGCTMLFLAGVIGGKTRRSAMETVKMSFGEKGGIFFSFLNVLQLVGWTAIMIYDGALAANGVLHTGSWVWCLVIGALIVLWIFIGITNLGKINTIAMAALFILTLVLCTMRESFYLSNICPQKPGLNRGIWKDLEEQARLWAKENGSLLIVTGPVITDDLKRLGKNRVGIPKTFYKVICTITNGKPEGVGFLFDNKDYGKTPLKSMMIPIDSVEKVTGIDFFPSLPDSIENPMEAYVNDGSWSF